MVDALVEKYPWMAKFECSWAAEVFLSLHINQKNTQRRKRAKESAHITMCMDGMSAYSVYLP